MTRTLRPVLLCLLVAVPAVVVRAAHVGLVPGLALLVFGATVVAASFVLAWAAEAAEVDIAGGLAIAVLAVIAVLPEYAVDLYFAYTAGSRPEHVQFAAANMTGSNRLLLGVGWSVVVISSLVVARRRTGRPVRALVLDPAYRVEIGFLALASLLALVVPATGRIPLVLGLVLLGVFAFYLVRVAGTGDDGEPDLVGPAARIGALPRRLRRTVVVSMFVVAAGVLLLSARPFAEALIASGQALGVDQFLLVQWLAPLASEAPELIVALIFALRGRGAAALGLLVAAKVNQWTLLVGSLPVAYLLGGGSTSLVLDGRQVEEFSLTIAQTLMGVAVLMTLRFPRWAAWTLLVLFAVQFAVPGTGGRLVLTAAYAALAAVALVVNRRGILPALVAPFRAGAVPDEAAGVLPERELSGRP